MIAASLRARIDAARANRLLRAGSVLVGGTAVAQAMTVLALPILTRLYSPADFQVFAVYSATLAILAVIACARLEIAIPIPKRDYEAVNLLALALVSAAVIAALTALAVFAFPSFIATMIGWDASPAYLWLFPVGVIMSGSYAAAQLWATRRRNFGDIARTRATQVATGLTVQIAFGILRIAPLGLLLGHLLTSAAGSLRLWRSAFRHDRRLLSAISPRRMMATLRRHRQFPLFSVIDALATNGANQLPLIIIAALVSGPEAGFLLLAIRLVGAPVQLIGNATSQVFLSHAAEQHHGGQLGRATENIVRPLMVWGASAIIFGSFAASQLFGLVFGAEWERAGIILMWVAPWSALRLVTSPISMVAAIVGRQRNIMFVKVTTRTRLHARWRSSRRIRTCGRQWGARGDELPKIVTRSRRSMPCSSIGSACRKSHQLRFTTLKSSNCASVC
jgi:O-antigen/teichoic acid export membrane protein